MTYFNTKIAKTDAKNDLTANMTECQAGLSATQQPQRIQWQGRKRRERGKQARHQQQLQARRMDFIKNNKQNTNQKTAQNVHRQCGKIRIAKSSSNPRINHKAQNRA